MIKKAFNRLKAKAFSKEDEKPNNKKLEKLYKAALILEQEDKKKQQHFFNQKGTYSPQIKEVTTQLKQSNTLIKFAWHHDIPAFIKIMRDATLPHSNLALHKLDQIQIKKALTIGYKIDLITGDCLLYGYIGNVLCPLIFRLAELEGITLDPIAHEALYEKS